ncbi:GMC oxidoreductase [Cylindrobasidium torrendii FP15055 ss-10]|uniref:GMC oxidoreductase n=1 Tax=Cylindrobasidium torrendii FP15055 ss-10 TaxID=1314674 RepID=A0A0D7BHD9_9AGAR|nr:GMC oxidoreductase [Cylindrobasidium torrendii FP15055 ss-10]
MLFLSFILASLGHSALSLEPRVSIAPEYDVIFAGGGTAASIIAARLSKAAPDLKILVLEAGTSTREKLEHIQPGRYTTHLAPYSTSEHFYVAEPSADLGGRRAVVATGSCIGGGSSVNFMYYNRPSASDFDAWATEYNNTGWGSDALIPLLIAAETYEIDNPSNISTHGFSGPLKVSYGGFQTDVGTQFLEVGPQFEVGRPLANEGNDFSEKSINVFHKAPKWIGLDGTRSDAAHHYLYPEETNPNLVISHGSRVVRVTFENTTATGVEFVWDKHVFPSYSRATQTVRATKLVVVSAGAMGTPLILERSGVGSSSVLEPLGISTVADLPVGNTYRDHLLINPPYVMAEGTRTMDALFRGEQDAWTAGLEQWDANRTGPVAATGVDAILKLRPTENEVDEIGQEFRTVWERDYADKADKPVFTFVPIGGLPGSQTGLPVANYLAMGVIMGYPVGTGYVHISSKDDAYAAPRFNTGFLSDISDIQVMRWSYKKGRELARRMPSYRGALGGPLFSSALNETMPVAINASTLSYSSEDDAAIDEYLRAIVGTTWHSQGTVPMKLRADGGILDSKLNVYGTHKLKVADLSILPSNVNANTYSTTIAIAEKAFLIIFEELARSA